ncbi:hypothetical protein O4J55_08480 [Paracoccus sp. PXZ]
MLQGFVVEIGHAAVDLEIVQPLLDGAGGHRSQLDLGQRVARNEGLGQQRGGGHGRGDDAQPQPPGQPAPVPAVQVVMQAVVIRQDLPAPMQHPFALRRQRQETVAADDQAQVQLVLQLADGVGQRGLRDIAALGRPAEMLLFGKRHKEFEVAYQHGRGPVLSLSSL